MNVTEKDLKPLKMATPDELKHFKGTITETKKFLERQPTQWGKEWITRDSSGRRIYIV